LREAGDRIKVARRGHRAFPTSGRAPSPAPRTGTLPFSTVVTATPPDLIQHAVILQTLACTAMPGYRCPCRCTTRCMSKGHHPHGRRHGAHMVEKKAFFPENAGPTVMDRTFFDVAEVPRAALAARHW
jgi:hypothetical protein